MKLYDIVFSPTGGTKKVVDDLIGALEGDVTTVDLTDSKQNFQTVQLNREDVAIISVPSYGGRVPAVAAERLGMVHGNGARAILVCVYGNRAYEDTLVELEDAAKQAGFQVIAAVAAIAEHSIARQFAAGRPDAQDAKQLADFAKQNLRNHLSRTQKRAFVIKTRKESGAKCRDKERVFTREILAYETLALELLEEKLLIVNPKRSIKHRVFFDM